MIARAATLSLRDLLWLTWGCGMYVIGYRWGRKDGRNRGRGPISKREWRKLLKGNAQWRSRVDTVDGYPAGDKRRGGMVPGRGSIPTRPPKPAHVQSDKRRGERA